MICKALAGRLKDGLQNVGQHLKAIESSGELDFSSKRKKFFTLDESGGQVAKVPIYHYNLDVIIALGYKIDLAEEGQQL